MANSSPKVLNISLPSASPTRGGHAKRRATNSRVEGFEWDLPGKTPGSSSYVSFLSSMQPFSSAHPGSSPRRFSLRSPLLLLCAIITLAFAIAAFIFISTRLSKRAADRWSTTTDPSETFSSDTSADDATSESSWSSSSSSLSSSSSASAFGKSTSLGSSSSLDDDGDSGFGSSSATSRYGSGSSLGGDSAFSSKGAWKSKSRSGFDSDPDNSWSKSSSSSSSLASSDDSEEDSNPQSSSSSFSTSASSSSWPRKRTSSALRTEDDDSSEPSFGSAKSSRGFGSGSTGRLSGFSSRTKRSTELYPEEPLDPSSLSLPKKKKRKGFGASWLAAPGDTADSEPLYGTKKKYKKRSGAFSADSDEPASLSSSEADSFKPRKRSRFGATDFSSYGSSSRRGGSDGGLMGEDRDSLSSSSFRKSRKSSKRRKRAGQFGSADLDAGSSDVDSVGGRSSWNGGRGKVGLSGDSGEAGDSDASSSTKSDLGGYKSDLGGYKSELGSYGAYGRKRRRKSMIRSSSIAAEDEPSTLSITSRRKKTGRSAFGSGGGADGDADPEAGDTGSYGRRAGIRGSRNTFGVEESESADDSDGGTLGGRRKAKVRGRWATGLVGADEGSKVGDSDAGPDSDGVSSWSSSKLGMKKGGRGSMIGGFGRKGLSAEDEEEAEGAASLGKVGTRTKSFGMGGTSKNGDAEDEEGTSAFKSSFSSGSTLESGGAFASSGGSSFGSSKLSSFKSLHSSTEDEADDSATAGGGSSGGSSGDGLGSSSTFLSSETETKFSSEEPPSESKKKGVFWSFLGWFGGAKKEDSLEDSTTGSISEDGSTSSNSGSTSAFASTYGTKSSTGFLSSSGTKGIGAFSYTFGTKTSGNEDLDSVTDSPSVGDAGDDGVSSNYGSRKSSMSGNLVGGGGPWSSKSRGASSAFGRRKPTSEDVR